MLIMCYFQGPWFWSLDVKPRQDLLFLEMLSGILVCRLECRAEVYIIRSGKFLNISWAKSGFIMHPHVSPLESRIYAPFVHEKTGNKE